MVRSIVRPAVRRRISTWRAHFFLPDFLMPWPPVFRGPFPPAFLASSSRAFLSVVSSAPLFLRSSRCNGAASRREPGVCCYAPACCFAWKALSSSSSSFFAALGFLLWMGLVPAVARVSLCRQAHGRVLEGAREPAGRTSLS
jgi:hypothetical protein